MNYHLICNQWSNPNNILFQLANIFIVLSNINLRNRYNVLCIRFCLTLSSLFFSLWGWLVLCSLDTFLWNLLFVFINVFHLSCVLYEFYPFWTNLDADAQHIYNEFRLKDLVSKKTFNDIIYKNVWESHFLKKGDIYCVEELTAANRLSLLMSGRVAVIRNNILLTELTSSTFVDAAHWFTISKTDHSASIPTSKVTVMALEHCRLITWNKYLLRQALTCEPQLHAVINRIVGQHVIKTFYFN